MTLFEKTGALGGVVRHVIPGFRIPESAIDKDAALLEKLGVKIYLNSEITDIKMLKNAGYTAVILAVGASEPGRLKLEKGEPVNALEFLADFKEKDGKKEPCDGELWYRGYNIYSLIRSIGSGEFLKAAPSG